MDKENEEKQNNTLQQYCYSTESRQHRYLPVYRLIKEWFHYHLLSVSTASWKQQVKNLLYENQLLCYRAQDLCISVCSIQLFVCL